MMAWLTWPSVRSCRVNCNRNCTPSSAVPPTISQRAVLIVGLLTARRGNTSSFIVNIVISTKAANCIFSITNH